MQTLRQSIIAASDTPSPREASLLAGQGDSRRAGKERSPGPMEIHEAALGSNPVCVWLKIAFLQNGSNRKSLICDSKRYILRKRIENKAFRNKMQTGVKMKSLEELIRNNILQDPDDIEALLEVAEITRQLVSDGADCEISRLISYTIENSCFEAFSWIMAILQEELEKPEGAGLKSFGCELGQSIPHFNDFSQRLAVDFNAVDNDVEKKYDDHGEDLSFFNIFKYKTAYKNIFLLTEENFDLKDNDFIQYKLIFTKDV